MKRGTLLAFIGDSRGKKVGKCLKKGGKSHKTGGNISTLVYARLEAMVNDGGMMCASISHISCMCASRGVMFPPHLCGFPLF